MIEFHYSDLIEQIYCHLVTISTPIVLTNPALHFRW